MEPTLTKYTLRQSLRYLPTKIGLWMSGIMIAQIFSGCAAVRNPIKQENQPESLFGSNYTKNLATYYFGDGTQSGRLAVESGDFDQALFYMAASAAPGEKEAAKQKAKLIRDRVVYDMIRISDKLYGDFKDRLFSGKATMDSGFKIIDLALTGAAAALGDKGTKSGLAAAATFLGGSKLAIDESFYAKQTVTNLVSTMDGLRAETKLKIVNGLTKGPDEFSLSAALSLVQEYHRRGSMLEALVELSRLSNEKSAQQVSTLSAVETKANAR